jgi:hypothetical protein
MIEIPVLGLEPPVVFQFREMSPEEALDWTSKVQSRKLYLEALQKEQEIMEHIPIADRDMDKFLAVSDKISKLMVQIVELSKSLAKYVVVPDQKAVETLLNNHPARVFDAMATFFTRLFPDEEERKKS